MVFSNWLSWMKTRAARRQFVVPPLGGVLIGQAGAAGRLKGELRTRRWSLNAQLAGAEVLEDRALLAAFVVSGSTLQVNLGASESVAITSAGSSYALALTGGTWSGTDGAGATGSGLTTLTATAAAFSTVTVDDSGASTAVTFNNSGANTYTSSILVTLDDAAAGTITFNGTTAFAGTAALSASTSKNIVVADGAAVSTVSGNIDFSANRQAVSTSGTFTGVAIGNGTGATVTSSSGNVTIAGTAGAGGGTGVFVSGTTSMTSIVGGSSATGTVSVTGQGGAGGSSSNYGVRVSGGKINSGGGNIIVMGTGGGGTGFNSHGVVVENGMVQAGGVGTVMVTGTGGTSSGGANYGVDLLTRADAISSGAGTITLSATGGSGGPAGDNSRGLALQGGGISSSGDILITAAASSGSNALQTDGGNSTVTTTGSGNISIKADSAFISSSISAQSRSVSIAPLTPGRSIDLGSTSDAVAGTMGLSVSELGLITAGSFNLGDANTAIINVSANITLPGGTTLNLTAAAINLNGNSISGGTVNQTTTNQPVISLEQPAGTAMASGVTKSFGVVPIGNTPDLVFTVKNLGSADLTGLTITGLSGTDYSVFASPATSVVPNGSTTFTIRFTPTNTGVKLATLNLASNALGSPSFVIQLTGIGAVELSGTKSVGPTGEYSSLTAAISAIQGNGGVTGPVLLELQPTYVSTVETFPLVFRYLGTTATNTLTIRPQAGATGLSISSADTTAATVDLNGAQFVTFDGRPGGVGTAKELTIEKVTIDLTHHTVARITRHRFSVHNPEHLS